MWFWVPSGLTELICVGRERQADRKTKAGEGKDLRYCEGTEYEVTGG